MPYSNLILNALIISLTFNAQPARVPAKWQLSERGTGRVRKPSLKSSAPFQRRMSIRPAGLGRALTGARGQRRHRDHHPRQDTRHRHCRILAAHRPLLYYGERPAAKRSTSPLAANDNKTRCAGNVDIKRRRLAFRRSSETRRDAGL